MIQHILVSLLVLCISLPVFAQDASVLPKYGFIQKTPAQIASDKQFVSAIEKHYKGDKGLGSVDAAKRGWVSLRAGNTAQAMRYFNQSWMLDASNGSALWGMATVQASVFRHEEALTLFSEAQRFLDNDIDFAVDHARALGLIGAQSNNQHLVKQSLEKFRLIQTRAPEHTLNFQNWAMTLFYIENYREAWEKIKLAEKTKRVHELDKNFVQELHKKLPRP